MGAVGRVSVLMRGGGVVAVSWIGIGGEGG